MAGTVAGLSGPFNHGQSQSGGRIGTTLAVRSLL
jgi:hypothetical protein